MSTTQNWAAFNALIVDDEPLARTGIRRLLAAHAVVSSVSEATNGTEAVNLIRVERPHLVFLDVEMPEMDGFDVVQEIGVDSMPPVVFVTAHNQYAIQAFEINAIDYLLKPVTRARFDRAFDRARTRAPAGKHDQDRLLSLLETLAASSKYLKRLAVRSAGSTTFVDLPDVTWLQAAENYVQVHTGSAQFFVHAPIQSIEATLNPEEFLRIHRSVIVNLKQVKELTPAANGEYIFVLRCGTRLRSSRTYHHAVKSWAINPF